MFVYPCKPMRLYPNSTLFKQLNNNPLYIAEVKKNGWRTLVEVNNSKLTLWTRHGTTINSPLKELREYLLDSLGDNVILDGELLDRRTLEVKSFLYLFDIICINDNLITNLPLQERRKLLESIVVEKENLVELSRWVYTDKETLYRESIQGEANEGIVIKKLDSRYTISPKKCIVTPDWIKVKK